MGHCNTFAGEVRENGQIVPLSREVARAAASNMRALKGSTVHNRYLPISCMRKHMVAAGNGTSREEREI